MENDAGYTDKLKAAGFEDFHYHSQSAGPDSISPEDWDQRRAIWGQVLPGVTAPSEVGLTYCMVAWQDIARVQDMHALWSAKTPTEEQRRNEVAARLLEMEVTAKQVATNLADLIDAVRKLKIERLPSVMLCESV
jgi:hypothetical protein